MCGVTAICSLGEYAEALHFSAGFFMDTFSSFPTTPISPARSAVTVVPSDANELPHVSRAIYVGQSGNLAVEMADGDVAIFETVPAGTMLPIRAARVLSTGTTAASVVCLW